MEYFKRDKNLNIEERKIREYLLNIAHADGGGKAKYFRRLGNAADDWELFAKALKSHAINAEIGQISSTPFGLKFIIKRHIGNHECDHVFIRSVWVVNKLDNFPILVTAYPFKQ